MILDAIADRNEVQRSLCTPLADTPMYESFGRLAGCSFAYYVHVCDKVLTADFFEQSDSKNLLAGDTPVRYRRTVLEPADSVAANDLVKNFLGRPQSMQLVRRWMAAEFDAVALHRWF